jgi:hypothetical protein
MGMISPAVVCRLAAIRQWTPIPCLGRINGRPKISSLFGFGRCNSPVPRTQTHAYTADLEVALALLPSDTAARRATAHFELARNSTIKASQTMPCKSHILLTELPEDLLSCIAQHLQQDVGRWDWTLGDVAALRSVCRSLRHFTDRTATHAKFHPHVDVEGLRRVTSRCAGG